MGELIVLPRAERPSRPASIRGGGAEILFFTGVRYYRMTDEMLSEIAKPVRRRRSVAARIDAARVEVTRTDAEPQIDRPRKRRGA